jgi:hypothetical protein
VLHFDLEIAHVTGHFDADGWKNYLEKVFPQKLNTYLNTHLKAQDECFVKWLSGPVADYLHYNFSTTDLRNGANYLSVIISLFPETGGRIAVMQLVNTLLQNENSWLIRGQALNNDKLLKEYQNIQLKQSGPNIDWVSFIEQFHKAFDIAAEGAHVPHNATGLANRMSALFYNIGGPVIMLVGNALKKGITAATTARMQVGFMGTLLKKDNPNLEIVSARGRMTTANAADIIDEGMAEITGKRAAGYYDGGVRKALAESGLAPGEVPEEVNILALVDKSKLKARPKAANTQAGRDEWIINGTQIVDGKTVWKQSLDQIVSQKVASGTVGLIFMGVMSGIALKQFLHADAKDRWEMGTNFTSNFVAFLGGASETVGHALEATAWGMGKSPVLTTLLRFSSNAKGLIGIGRLFGAAGGIITGVLTGVAGWEIYDAHPVLGVASMFAGGGLAVVSLVTLIFSSSEAVAARGGVIGMILVAIIWVISLYFPDDLQAWFEKTMYFGNDVKNQFRSFAIQIEELNKLVKPAPAQPASPKGA